MTEILIWHDVNTQLPENRQKVLFRLDDNTIKGATFVKHYSTEHIETDDVFKSEDRGLYILYSGQEENKMKGYTITHWCAYPSFEPLKQTEQ